MNTKLIIGVVAVGAVLVLIALMTSGKDAPVTETGDVGSVSVTIPADMPTNVPMYPDSEVEAVQDSSHDGERNIGLSLLTRDSVADVNTWYRGALKANGWAVTSDKTVGGYVLLQGENGNITVFMQAANGEGGTVITQRVRIKE